MLFLHVLIHPTSSRYLRFALKDKIFQFRALPFGLPICVHSSHEIIACHLHRKVITLFPYLDGWLLRNQNHQHVLEHRKFIIQLIVNLGLIANQEKSDLILSHKFIFIGMEFLTHHNVVKFLKTEFRLC